ncbi:bifunctional ADP-dependent NAD(P)H-hydrate dehydratase/NAD(P)H-hydrate epimerase [Erythrobacter litoralis]|uniref:Bifunctional NAD(P)H-hydrate repair enzyme n=1 Tax=Erythrobacter litoralis (strain HTCC2594) TaxID=314225 RepID=Q2NA19_ERYLH|nr:bifunctional ADP-dependent NAD(P)H-hydrate dehydratase/NAD(P)H-hydrate epimerase [Erythrobacter litoralis]ABC63472.1 sugar kinase [Erythrobacter litoralis HTCC2594]
MPNSANLRQVLTVAEMQAAERDLMDAGISVHELMQRAGQGAADWIWRMTGGRPVTVLCGPGNNGGDGYVIAAEIARRGGEVRVVAPMPPKTEAAKRAAETFKGKVTTSGEGLRGEVLVDCLFGSGLSRPLSAEHRALLRRLRMEHALGVAIDVASGVDADSGAWPEGMAAWDCTIALGAWKRAHWIGEASAKCGTRKLVDIGVAARSEDEQLAPEPDFARPAWDAHKYRRGLLAVVGGAMPGASELAACAAVGAGAGYVKLLGSDNSRRQLPPDLVEKNGDLTELLSDERISAILVGPGLGRGEEARDRLAHALAEGEPTVCDADALHLLDDEMLDGVDGTKIIVTPHEGELAQLCKNFGVIAASKRERAMAVHSRTGLTVLAKGPDTILAHDGGVAYFPQGSSWLSVAGSGDVLAGIVASRLATGDTPARAAMAGVYLHQQAAREAAGPFSASDLAQAIPAAYRAFL